MNINEIIMLILAAFLLLGGIDYLAGNRLGLGEKFKEGIMSMGTLALVIVGIVSLAPVIANILTPIVTPLYRWIGADPSTFANTILALDMGGQALAEQMAESNEAALFAWVFLGTMLGPTISFTIPVALSMITKQDHSYFAKGIMIGISTIPIGCLIGGFYAGLDWSMMFRNLVIPIVFSICILIGLLFFADNMMILFHWLGKTVTTIALIGLLAIGIETITEITVIPGLAPLEDGIQIVGLIAIVLAGAFPFVAVITKLASKHLQKIGNSLQINSASTAGLIASVAHVIPMLALLTQMNERGKVMNVAFAVSGAFVFGGHLGFVAGIESSMVIAMIIGKLSSGISAIVLALLLTSSKDSNILAKNSM
ncbi:ethanolamine utilization protein EutH [Oceanobacillus kimchii]|uniref:ethanolamine utilization protein EutH n=1 Tax=Oceanobacillus kimchii TaxID=746691 RepID=UPI00034937D6|nr:ethanolamine utilization protein EutH [Oceanobacillus kimchii]